MNMLTAKQIEAIRKALGLTHTELAAKVGVSADAARKWERDDCHPRWEAMEKLNDLARQAIAAGKLPKNFLQIPVSA